MNRKEELLYKILDYPIVQYITIKPHQMHFEPNWNDPLPKGEPRMYIFNQWQQVKEDLNMYKIKIRDFNEKLLSDRMFIITHNIKIVDIKYRTYSVVLVGKSEPNSFYLYNLTTRDFYRQSLNFLLYNEIGSLVQSKVVRLS